MFSGCGRDFVSWWVDSILSFVFYMDSVFNERGIVFFNFIGEEIGVFI